MSVLGDRIIADGPFVAGGALPLWMGVRPAEQWNALRQELIELRARDAELKRLREILPGVHATVVGPSRPCPVCRMVKIGADMVECTSCAGREDAAAKRAADQ